MKAALLTLTFSLLAGTAMAGEDYHNPPPKSDPANVNTNVNSNSQHQSQSQGQSQSSANTNTNGVIVQNGNGNYPYVTNPATAAGAYAPSIWGGNVCSVGASGGVQVPLFGISLGSQWEGENCEWRQRVALVSQINRNAGKELACSKKEVREAFLRAGEPCQADMATMAQQPKPVSVVSYNYPPCTMFRRDNCVSGGGQ